MSNIQFKIATTENAENIARLVNAAYRPHPDTGGWTHEAHLVQGERTSPQQVEVLIKASTVLVGTLAERVVACAHISAEGEEAHIGMLAVEPALQTGGIGKALLTRAEEYASQVLGATDLMLIVLRNRSELIAFYLRRGYQDGSHVWKVGGKVFAIGGWSQFDKPAVTFKTSVLNFDVLRDQPGFRPAPYLASRGMKWIQQYDVPDNTDDELKYYLKESHHIVSLGLTKKIQKQLGLNQDCAY